VTYRRAMAEKRRLIWPIVVALVLNVAMFALIVYPLSKKVAAGEQQAQNAAVALAAAKRDYTSARQTVTGKQQADAELVKFYESVLPPDLSGARRITFLRIPQLAQQSNLRLETQTSTPSQLRDSDLGKLTHSAVLTGEYRDIRRFVHQLETSPEFLVLERVELTQNEAESARGITVIVQIATYFRNASDGN
jgi:Tfp pilus assembly protein PilO